MLSLRDPQRSPTSTLYSAPMNDAPGVRSRVTFAAIAERVCSGHRLGGRNHDNGRVACDTIADARDHAFRLGAAVGEMCTLFLSVPRDSTRLAERPSLDDDPFWLEDSAEKERVATQLGEVFLQLFRAAFVCKLDLVTCVLKKIELNGRKYPVELCKGKSGKYTNYSEQTGITTIEGQSTVNSPTKSSTNAMEDITTVEGITVLIRNFASERLWNQYHTPRNIALALMGEFGELAELFQWRGDEGELELKEEELDKIGQEIADVTIYLLRLADVCHVRLGVLAMDLLEEGS